MAGVFVLVHADVDVGAAIAAHACAAPDLLAVNGQLDGRQSDAVADIHVHVHVQYVYINQSSVVTCMSLYVMLKSMLTGNQFQTISTEERLYL